MQMQIERKIFNSIKHICLSKVFDDEFTRAGQDVKCFMSGSPSSTSGLK